VTMTTSAARVAISPMIGRLPGSRSPPQPNTTMSRPVTKGRSAQAPFRARRACGRNRRTLARLGSRRCAPAGRARLRVFPARRTRARRASRSRCRDPPRRAHWRLGNRRATGGARRRARHRGKRESGRETLAHGLDEPDRLAARADGEGPATGRAHGVDNARSDVAVGVDDRGRARRQKLAQQPQFGVEIVGLGRVVVHVVARQIGESGGGGGHAVEPLLVEPVRGRLHREMGDSGLSEFRQRLVQRDGSGVVSEP